MREGLEGIEYLVAKLRRDQWAVVPVDVSHRRVASQVGTGIQERVRDGASPS